VSFTQSLFIQLFLGYKLFLVQKLVLENKSLFLGKTIFRIKKIVDRKVHLDDTICKDNYHLQSYLGDTMYHVILNTVFSVVLCSFLELLCSITFHKFVISWCCEFFLKIQVQCTGICA
jgi:hypothetical protein